MPKIDPTITFGSVLNMVALVAAVGLSWGIMTTGGDHTRQRVEELMNLIEKERSARGSNFQEERQARIESLRDLENRLRNLETSTARAEARTDEKFNTILQTLGRLELVLSEQNQKIGGGR